MAVNCETHLCVQMKTKIPKTVYPGILFKFELYSWPSSEPHVPLLADDNPVPCEVIKQFFPPLHSCSFRSINLTTELSNRWLSSKP